MSEIIRTHGLKKEYKNEIAVKHLDFVLQSGEICAFIGKNGAGKSTFFKMLSGQIQPTTGELQLFGMTDKDLLDARKKFGFMIEEPQFFMDFTAKQNLEYFRIQRGVPSKERINEVLEIVGLADQPKKKFKEYSVGMKQRLGLALCLLSSPDCLVLDEPTNGLDAQGINEIRQLLITLNQERHITILISSHILSELKLVATRFVFVNHGEIVEDLNADALHQKSKQQLRIHLDQVSKAAQLLEVAFSDIDYQVLPGDWLFLYNHIEDSAAINSLLNNHQLSIYEFQIAEVSLENYFLELIGQEELK